jgi:hypothetical protein
VVARMSAAGGMDRSFAEEGAFRLEGGIGTKPAWTSVLAIGADASRVIVIGAARRGPHRFPCVIRLTSSGALDLSYGTDGIAVRMNSEDAPAYTASVDGSGRAVFARAAGVAYVERLDRTGQPDDSFYFQGRHWLSLAPGMVRTDGEGRVVLLSDGTGGASNPTWMHLRRLDADGRVDDFWGTSTFVPGGTGRAAFEDVAIASDGRIFATLSHDRTGGRRRVHVAFDAAGRLVSGFGSAGVLDTGASTRLVLDASDRLYTTDGSRLVARGGDGALETWTPAVDTRVTPVRGGAFHLDDANRLYAIGVAPVTIGFPFEITLDLPSIARFIEPAWAPTLPE